MAMKNGILKFLVAILAVVGVVVCLDWLVGKAMEKVLPAISKQGQNGMTYYSLNEVDAPVVVVGSSRASHHYVSSMLSDSLGLDVYNIGRDGCFFSYNCCVINSILDRYSPEIIIWETSFDVLENSNDPMESLHPYYGKNEYVMECIDEDYDWTERVPLVSNIYKYNSNILRVMSRYVRRVSYVDDGLNGYIPLVPKKWNPVKSEGKKTVDTKVFEEKVERFKAVLAHSKSKGVRIIIFDSPVYMPSGDESRSSILMKGICDSMGVEIYDFKKAEEIYDKLEYFNDYSHMNSDGAERYTEMIIEKIMEKYEK